MGQQLFAFAPNVQPTVNITVGAAAAPLTLPLMSQDDNTILFTNIGTLPTFIYLAAAGATVANGLPILPNAQLALTIGPGIPIISVIGTGAGSVLYATAGKGI